MKFSRKMNKTSCSLLPAAQTNYLSLRLAAATSVSTYEKYSLYSLLTVLFPKLNYTLHSL